MERHHLYRDGVLAVATCTVLVAVSLRSGVGRDALVEPLPAAVGCVGMVVLEVGLLRVPDLTRRVWERPAVQAGSVLGVVLVGWVAASTGAAWLLGAFVWGLFAYVGLVGIVLALGRNPLG